MVKFKTKENYIFFIQVFQKGFDTSPTLKYYLKEYELTEGMLTIIDPKINLAKSFPSTICTVDTLPEVKE